ncbi:hypothetical protein GGX14DRAFT_567701 [Mycena pura]|uniref:Uncharacterized protein n=1 Tax=Mycena pura TaxID=153505 RepID=A0AAD6VE65_9AGAR|nr:hypothetical protein GGX14DRAFT_567701 [Mycena pura]
MSSTKNAVDFIDDDDLKTIGHMGSRASTSIQAAIADNVKVDERAAEIPNKMFTMFKELQTQKAGLVRMVSVLTAEEDDGDDD